MEEIDTEVAHDLRDRLEEKNINAEIIKNNYVRVRDVSGGDYWKIFDLIEELDGGFGKYDLAPTRRNEITIQRRR